MFIIIKVHEDTNHTRNNNKISFRSDWIEEVDFTNQIKKKCNIKTVEFYKKKYSLT